MNDETAKDAAVNETGAAAIPSGPETDAKPEDGALDPMVKPPIGDASRWKRLDPTAEVYEVKDRGVIVRTYMGVAFVPSVKLAPDINNGFRIVAA